MVLSEHDDTIFSGCWKLETEDDMWCSGHHVWFPSKHLPPLLECGFESWLGLEFRPLVCGIF